ncbi:MAG TPA: hypothetical protein GXX28_06245 [Firmicutes bacterium]|nr:hypothetical protein [Bacillota bacterium]
MTERQLIPVGKEEQITGLVRELRRSGARQVVFAVPAESTVLRSLANLRLLKFYAEQEGKTVRLVTGDAVVQRLADEAGIDWTVPERETPSSSVRPFPVAEPADLRRPAPWPRPSVRHLLAVPLLILALGAWQLFAGPMVTVTVHPAVKEYACELTLQGQVDGHPGKGRIALTSLECQVTATGSAAPTGHRRYGVTRAKGTVAFLNQKPQAVRVPAGTVVTTAAGLAFRTLETIQVPGVKTEYFMKIAVGLRAGQAEARIEAVDPGSEGNVSAGRITKLKGPLAGVLQLTNPEPTRGGEDRSVSVVTAADVGRAEREAAALLARQARGALEAQVPPGLRLIPESIRLSPPSLRTQGQPGDEVPEVVAEASATAFGLLYRPEAVAKAAVEAYLRTVPEGHVALPETIVPGVPRFSRVEPELAELIVPVGGRIVPRVEAAAVRQAVRGKTLAEAEAAVKALPGVESVTITGARGRLPSWSGRLRIAVGSPEGTL